MEYEITAPGVVEVAAYVTTAKQEPAPAATVIVEGHVIAGNGFTFIVIVDVDVQPKPFVPVTVYVVVVEGVTEITAVVAPVFQL
jgi:hypothetical protein